MNLKNWLILVFTFSSAVFAARTSDTEFAKINNEFSTLLKTCTEAKNFIVDDEYKNRFDQVKKFINSENHIFPLDINAAASQIKVSLEANFLSNREYFDPIKDKSGKTIKKPAIKESRAKCDLSKKNLRDFNPVVLRQTEEVLKLSVNSNLLSAMCLGEDVDSAKRAKIINYFKNKNDGKINIGFNFILTNDPSDPNNSNDGTKCNKLSLSEDYGGEKIIQIYLNPFNAKSVISAKIMAEAICNTSFDEISSSEKSDKNSSKKDSKPSIPAQ